MTETKRVIEIPEDCWSLEKDCLFYNTENYRCSLYDKTGDGWLMVESKPSWCRAIRVEVIEKGDNTNVESK